MAHVVKIKNKKYVTASDAGKLFGYTSDYVARLAREGKVKGQRLGREWLVDPRSLEAFSKSTAVLKQRRNEELRRERKEERSPNLEEASQSSEISAPRVVAKAATGSAALAPAEHIALASHRVVGAGDLELKLRALLGASGVVFAGIMLGVIVHAGPNDTLAQARSVAAAFDAREMLSSVAHGVGAHTNILGRTLTGVLARDNVPSYGEASLASATEDMWCGVTSFFGYTCARDHLVEGEVDTGALEEVPSAPAPAPIPAPVRVVERITTTLPADPAPTYVTNITNPVTVIREEITNYTELTTRVLHENQTNATFDSFEGGIAAVGQDVGNRFTAIGESFTTELLTVNGNATVLGDLTVAGITSTSTITSYGVATAPYFVATSTTATSTFGGGFAVDTSGFVYDWSTNNVGIGTTSPSQKLSVSGNTYVDGDLSVSGTVSLIGLSLSSYLSAPRVVITDAAATSTFAGGLTIDTDGFVYDLATDRVGVGTSTPAQRFSVSGNGYVTGGFGIGIATTTAGVLQTSGNAWIGGDLDVIGTLTAPELTASGDVEASYFTATDAAATSTFAGGLVVATNGLVYDFSTNRIGIGTTSPSQKFSVSGNGYFSGGLGVGIATTTAGAFQTSGNGWIGGNLTVVGDSTVLGNSTTVGGSTSDTLTINSSINSNLVPDLNAMRNLGSPSYYWNDVYVDTINANNISAASTTISGTQSADFTFNSDNSSVDTEDINLIFYRGTVVPNALITWDSTRDRFDFNQALFVQNDSSTTTVVSLDVAGTSGQTADLFRVRSFASSPYFSVSASGRIGVGTSTPASTFDIFGTDALRIPVGTTAQRPADTLVGQVRYNTTTAQFEGYGTSLVWQGLGGVIDVDQDTYVTAEENSDEDYLRFYTAGSERLTVTNTGTVGIGTTTPGARLHALSTTEQLRLGYDATNYASFTVSSGGDLTIASSGGQTTIANASTTALTVSGTASTTNIQVSDDLVLEALTANRLLSIDGNKTAATVAALTSWIAGTASQITVTDDGDGTVTLALPSEISFSSATTTNFYASSLTAGTFAAGQTGTTTIAATGALSSPSLTATSLTAGRVTYAGTGGLLSDSSAFTFDSALSKLTVTNASTTNLTVATSFLPNTDDGAALGASGRAFADLFLASGGVINWNAGDVTATHAANTLTFAGASSGYVFSDGSVGVGTTSPYAKLSVTNTGSGPSFIVEDSTSPDSTPFIINASGSVGIGTGNPSRTFDVRGGANVLVNITSSIAAGSGGGGGMTLGTDASLSSGDRIGFFLFGDEAGLGNATGITSFRNGSGADLRFETHNGSSRSERMIIDPDGNVGIGTSTPQSTLTIHSGQITVPIGDATAPSYAFNDDLNTGIYASTADQLAFATGGSNRGIIHSGGWQSSVGFDANNGSAGGPSYSFTSDTDAGLYASPGTYLSLATAGVDRMTILEGGNVGIGTTTPATRLGVKGRVRIEALSAGDASSVLEMVNNAGAAGYFYLDNSSNFTFQTPSTASALTILDGGNVGIGTTGPDEKLDVAGLIAFDSANYASFVETRASGLHLDTSDEIEFLGATSASGYGHRIYNTDPGGGTDLRIAGRSNSGSWTDLVSIEDTGNVGIGTTGPDRKLDILDASNPQLRLTQTDGSIYTDLQVAASTGDLTINLQPNTSAENLYLIQSGGTTGANLRVCEGSACPSVTISNGGNVLVENGYYFGNGYRIDQVAGTTTEIAVYDTAGAAILIFDEF